MATSSLPNTASATRFPDDNRIELALAAAGQIECLALAMREQMEDGPPPREPILNLVAVRLFDLSHVILSALDDKVAEYEDLRKIANHGQTIIVGVDEDEEGGMNDHP